MQPITNILGAAASGDEEASATLLPLVYDELRKLAEARLAKTPPGNTLQPTALVHEAYLRLIGSGDPGWDGRNHFFGAAAQAMRDILVEQARRKSRIKRGGDRKRVSLEGIDSDAPVDARPEEVLAVNDSLTALEAEDPRAAQVVVLRYFGGLSESEAAAILGVSESTVTREWRYARSWLFRRMSSEASGESS